VLVSAECLTAVPDDVSAVKCRSRKPEPEQWKKNIRKCLRQSGLEYENTRGVIVPEKLLTTSTCNCPRKCRSKVPDEERPIIFNNFKSMGGPNMQAAFIAGHVSSVKKNALNPHRRVVL